MRSFAMAQTVFHALGGAALAFGLLFSSLSPVFGSGEARAAEKIIRAGFCPGPYASLFYAALRPGLQAKGYRIEFREYPDYVKPNLALVNNEIDCNMFQHSVYLENFKKQHKADISAVAIVPTVSMGIYSLSVPSLDRIPNNARTTIPNDPANMARALRLLQAAALINMNPAANPAAYTEKDITTNPRALTIIPLDATGVADSLKDAELAVVNGNFAIYAGLTASQALYSESLTPNMLNVIAIRTSDKGTDLEKDLIDVIKSEAYNKVISDPLRIYNAFQKPAAQPFK